VAYTVQLVKTAVREYDKLPAKIKRRIDEAFEELEQNPRPPGCKKLTEAQGVYRIRVGDYRVLYEIDDDQRVLEVLVVKISNRADVYRYLKTRR
jgi:mRNA interferase RelE/StbE